MNSNVITIATILGALFLVHKYLTPDVKEGFGTLPPITYKMNRVAESSNGFFEIPGNYQAILAPRMTNVDYGAFIRYNTPSTKNLAADPKDPLFLNNMVKIREDYCGAGQALGSAKNVSQQKPMYSSYNEVTDLLPVSGVDGNVLNALGENAVQPIIYDRFIYANQKSRLNGLGDFIRGDLPIVPIRNEWMRPSAVPNIDLRAGALAVMGGIDNSTSKELLALQSAATGGLLDVGSGINYSVQQSPYSTTAGGDIQVSSFP